MMNIELGKIKQKIKKISHVSFFGLIKWQSIRFYESESTEQTMKGGTPVPEPKKK